MTKTVNIKPYQTQLDISVQEYGTVEAVLDLMFANDLSLTEALSPGQELEVVTSTYTNFEVLQHFKANALFPATKKAQDASGFITEVTYTAPAAPTNIVAAAAHQNLLDISLQETGTVESIIELCLENDLSLTDMLEVGAVIKHDVPTQNIEILTHYKSKNIKPATAKTVIAVVDTHYAVSTYVDINYWL